jgi:hypothetical protein
MRGRTRIRLILLSHRGFLFGIYFVRRIVDFTGVLGVSRDFVMVFCGEFVVPVWFFVVICVVVFGFEKMSLLENIFVDFLAVG